MAQEPPQPKEGVSELLAHQDLTFGQGIRSLPAGIKYLLSNPKALALCVAPWLVNLLLVTPLIVFLVKWQVYDRVIGLLPQDPSGWMVPVYYLLLFCVWMAMISLSVLVFFVVGLVIGAPFHDKLGETIERDLLEERPHLLAPSIPFWRGVWYSIFEALKRVLLIVPAVLLPLLAAPIPLVGPVIIVSLQYFLAACFLCLDSFSMPFDRRGVSMGAKVRWVFSNKSFAFGFGIPFLIVPCAIFIAPPLAAAAASVAYCRAVLARDRHRHGSDEQEDKEWNTLLPE